MKRKFLCLILSLVMMLSLVPVMVSAEPTISAPEHFGVSHYMIDSFYYTFSAPDDLRTILDNSATNLVVKAQLDYKPGNGDWHYTSAWDTAKYTLKNTLGFSYKKGEWYITGGREKLSTMFPDDTAALKSVIDSGWNMPPVALSFRVRFVTSLDNKTYIYSDWSDTYVYSKDAVEDPDALINHAPTLTSATVIKNSGGMPFLKVLTGRLPGECQDLNAMTGGGMRTEVWMRKAGETDFKIINNGSFFTNEYILIGVDDYFDKNKASYDAEAYEIKIRYVLNNLDKYPQVERSDIIYSPFSNVYSQKMPAWSGASTWATAELTKAEDIGLIPDILQGADMTKPITREEFAELAVLLYDKTAATLSTPTSPNPFTDCDNPQVLKALNIGTTKGTSDTTFTPSKLINREECAAMLYRTIKAIAPDGEYSITGVKDFKDQLDISGWAVDATKYMYKMSIIKGDAEGRFMPKANPTALQATTYGKATREAAILMSVRTYDILK